ncbi:hypothetical protein [Streptomyces sp. S1D4-20]|uniref:deazapurine DNA modification protein DpdA family protein n=1 Tax=Streptomyces sp. S1D4-20 TaxID=2594462 RepID=UPI00196782C2|nr:hypothetical protein [Streptomyces sp. S1D4-20]
MIREKAMPTAQLTKAPATPSWRPLPEWKPLAETCTCGPWNRYTCGHCRHDQCLDCGMCAMSPCLCWCEYGLGFAPSDCPPEGPMFWLGGHHPTWLSTWNVPMCVSRNTLVGMSRLPRAAESWMCDSGAFTEIDRNGAWTVSPLQYVRDLYRFRDEIGRMCWAGPQDTMCEPDMVAKTGLSVARHIDLTVGNFIDLMSIDDSLDIYPTIQGWMVPDYVRCVEEYERRGVDLKAFPWVGVGSVCRRNNVREVYAILSTLADMGLRLHGYGLKGDALATCAEFLASADSLAWSADARWAASKTGPLPECVGKHKSCSNCIRWAMRWRERIIASLRSPRQTTLCLKPESGQDRPWHPLAAAPKGLVDWH